MPGTELFFHSGLLAQHNTTSILSWTLGLNLPVIRLQDCIHCYGYIRILVSTRPTQRAMYVALYVSCGWQVLGIYIISILYMAHNLM